MKVIFTDPCYLVPKEKWSDFLVRTDYGHDENAFPIRYGRAVKIYKAASTGVGDCGYTTSEGVRVVCDAGMFCVAEISNSLAAKQMVGKFFDVVEEALENWDTEMARCIRGSENEDEDDDYCSHCGRR